MSNKPLALGPRWTLIAALMVTPIYFFTIRLASALTNWMPFLHFVGMTVGCVGFVALLVWNGLLQKRTLIAANTFFSVWMFVYLTFALLTGK
jgi:hypothetical protein